MKRFLIPLISILFIGCGSSDSKKHIAPANVLVKQKCASCHNLDMPPKTSDKELAPPLFTVTVHLKEWIESSNPSENRYKFIDFVQDYVINPDREKSYCDPKSLKQYGLMPSQKGKVTKDELKAIAEYIYDLYDQKQLMEIMQKEYKIKALPLHEQVIARHDCKLCHISGANRVAPSFKAIGKRYQNRGTEPIIESIKNGSKGKWQNYHTLMRAYKDIPQNQLEAFAKWVLEEGKK